MPWVPALTRSQSAARSPLARPEAVLRASRVLESLCFSSRTSEQSQEAALIFPLDPIRAERSEGGLGRRARAR